MAFSSNTANVGPRRRIFAVLLCLVAGHALRAADEQSAENRVKAAFLFNFTKFVEWPPTAFSTDQSPFSICILGADPFGGVLDQIVEGESVNGRKLAVDRLERPPAPKACQVVYLSRSEKGVPRILAGMGPGVLTVGEGDSFLREGGMIAFVVENRRVRFDVNATVAGSALLKISSRLLNVARLVSK